MPRIKRWLEAKASAYNWVQSADQLYVAVRFLYWKGFPFEFALLGAHAMELYLKAYLIQRTGKYPVSHDLGEIYKECMKLDDFFKDEFLSRRFLPIKPPLPDTEATWTHYSGVLRYPEPLPREPRSKGAGIITGFGGTCRTLDCIAHFVKQAVPRLKGERDIIDDLINGDGYIWAINCPLVTCKR
jgi:hypothetical protein